MEVTPTPRDLERELEYLRARAYGTHPDIQDDPAALARLAELEARAHDTAVAAPPEAHAAPHAVPADAEPAARPGEGRAASSWRRLASSRAGRTWLAAGAGLAVVAVVAVAYGVAWLAGPHPDATLQPTNGEADLRVVGSMTWYLREVDVSTLRPYESFRGIQPWSAADSDGNPCLVLIERSTNMLLGAECTPPEGDLLADAGAWPAVRYEFGEGLPDGSIIRFHLHDGAVDAFVHLAPTEG